METLPQVNNQLIPVFHRKVTFFMTTVLRIIKDSGTED